MDIHLASQKYGNSLGPFFPSQPHEVARDWFVGAVIGAVCLNIALIVEEGYTQGAAIVVAIAALVLAPGILGRRRERERLKRLGLTKVRVGEETDEYPYPIPFTAIQNGRAVKGSLIPSDAQAYWVCIDDQAPL